MFYGFKQKCRTKKLDLRNHKCLHRFTFMLYTHNYILQDDTLKLFSLTFDKIYESLMKNNV